MTTVVIADDQDLIRGALQLVIEGHGCTVVGLASNGKEAVTVVAETQPDVVLMDVRMPVMDGIEATRRIAASGSTTRVVMLTTYDLDHYVYAALKAGAAGFLLKATPPERLVQGIETVAAGEALLAPSLTRRLIEQHVRRPGPRVGPPTELADLTEREREVFHLIARGFSNEQIAQELFVSTPTVKSHVHRILAKLHLDSRVQAVVLAYESGLFVPGEGLG